MSLLIFLALLIPAGLTAALVTDDVGDVFLLAVAGAAVLYAVLRLGLRWVQRSDPAESARTAWVNQPAMQNPPPDADAWSVLRGDSAVEPRVDAEPEP